jgi:hypothetical protein
MSMLVLICIYLLTFFGGWGIVSGLGSRHPAERLGLGILFGSSILTYLIFLFFAFLHLPLNISNVLLSVAVLVLIGLACIVLAKIPLKKDGVQLINWFKKGWQLRNYQMIDFLFLCFLALLFLFTFSQNMYWPIFDWDSLALYDFRAKVFAQTGGMFDGIQRGYFLHYPPYTSLLHMVNYLFGAQQAKIWYSFLYLSLLLVFYALLRRDTSRKVALLGATVVAISPTIFSHSQMAYTNLPHAIFTGLGYIYLMLWWRTPRRTDLLIGSFLISFGLWIRTTEPFWLPAVIIIVAGTIKHRKDIAASIITLLLLFFVKKPWLDYEFANDGVIPASPLSAAGQAFHQFQFNMATPRMIEVLLFLQRGVWGLFKPYLLALAIGFVFVFIKRDKVRLTEYGLFFFFIAYIILGTFVFSFGYPGWNAIPDSATRMSMFLILLCIYLLFRSPIWLLTSFKKKVKRPLAQRKRKRKS